MKLVEILARELDEWPNDKAACVGQAVDGTLYMRSDIDSVCFGWTKESFQISSDFGAIVTREMWQAERERIAKPGKKANAEGWILHRGGNCPVEAGTLVDVRYRSGKVNEHVKALVDSYTYGSMHTHNAVAWEHIGSANDIMAYRIHKPAGPEISATEIPSSCQGRSCQMPDAEGHSKECLLDAAIDQGWAGPIEWRDRISEIDRTVEALEEERVSLIQRLECEGFQLLQGKVCGAVRAVEDMSDYRNWKNGDLLECVSLEGKCIASLTIGKMYKYAGDGCVIDDDGDAQASPIKNGAALKWHSRPSA